jgi:hypothetical protein
MFTAVQLAPEHLERVNDARTQLNLSPKRKLWRQRHPTEHEQTYINFSVRGPSGGLFPRNRCVNHRASVVLETGNCVASYMPSSVAVRLGPHLKAFYEGLLIGTKQGPTFSSQLPGNCFMRI